MRRLMGLFWDIIWTIGIFLLGYLVGIYYGVGLVENILGGLV